MGETSDQATQFKPVTKFVCICAYAVATVLVMHRWTPENSTLFFVAEDLADEIKENSEPFFHVDPLAVGHGVCMFKKCLRIEFGLELTEKKAARKGEPLLPPYLGEAGQWRGFFTVF